MAIDRRIDIKQKWPIPTGIKFVLMLAVIFGFLLHNCWQNNKDKNISITSVKILELTKISADIIFSGTNSANVELTKTLKIELFTKSNELIASKLTNITIPAKSKKKFRKILQKFNFPILDTVGDVRIEIYR